MQEFDVIRLLIYGCSVMISVVTFLKHVRIEGVIGTSTKMISAGTFCVIGSLLIHILLSLLGNESNEINPLWELITIMAFVLGIGLVFFGLWKTSIFFDELHRQAEKQVIITQQSDAEQK